MPKDIAGTVDQASPVAVPVAAGGSAVFPVLVALGVCHFLNDMVQSLIPSLYPLLKTSYHLDFGEVGLITLAFQLSASMLQPLVGMYTDRRPLPFSLPIGMGFSLVGLLLLATASSYAGLLVAASMVGVGSSVFHPEASRVARMASGGRHGMAQSIFQVGGNAGQATGPLLAAVVVLSRGQPAVAWFALPTLLGMVILGRVGLWYKQHLARLAKNGAAVVAARAGTLSPRRLGMAIAVLTALTFSKAVYTASLTNYLTFYLIQKFALSVHAAQLHLFAFLAAVAAGTLLGGPIGDRIGRNNVIWLSILGVLPFTLLLPYAGLLGTEILIVIIGMLLASALPAILVYALELVPGRVGMIAGLFFGLSFGLSGISAAGLGMLADYTSIGLVYQICSYMPAIGLLAVFLPNVNRRKAVAA